MPLLKRRRPSDRRPASGRPVTPVVRLISGQTRPLGLCYAGALLFVALAAGLDLAWIRLLGPTAPFFLYLLAVAAAGLLGGLGPGLLAVAASFVAAVVFNIPPAGSFKVPAVMDAVRLGAFALAGLAMTGLTLHLRRVTRRLAETESRFRRLVEGIRDYAVVVLDAEGLILSWNAGAERMSGYEAAEAVGRDCSALIPSHAAEMTAELEEARLRGRFEGETWLQRKGGAMFWAALSTNAVYGDDGTLIGFSKIIRDLTLRTAGTGDKRSEDLFREMVESIQDYAIYRLDPDGRVATWTAGAERILGYRAEEIIGRPFSCFYSAAEAAAGKPRTNLRLAAERGRIESQSWKIRKDGSSFWADASMTALRDSSGRLVGFAKVVRDLTERKRAEQAMAAKNRQLEKAVADLEAFAYTVSHDLRAPLRAVQGYASLALRSPAAADAQARELLRRIADAAVRMDRLIQDLLSYSGIARGPAVMQPVDLDPVAAHVALHFSGLGARLSVKTPLGRVVGQESLLVQTLGNLVGNAAKFVPPAREPQVEVWSERRGGRVRVFVADNGIGVAEDAREKIFEPFIRLDQTYEGTGIGLAIVKKAVERMGGTVGVESRVGEGSRFWFELKEG